MKDDRISLTVETFVEILQLLYFQLQIYLEGLCHAASSYALPFDSIVEPEYKDEKTHVIFNDEMIILDYVDHSKRSKKMSPTKNSGNGQIVRARQNMASFSDVYMDDRFFGIIE